MKLNRVAEAAGAFRAVIKIGEDLTSRQPPVGFSREFLAESWLHLGQVETKSGRRSEGCAAFIKSVREYGETQKAGALRPPDQQLSEEAAKSAAACASPGN